MSDFLAGMAASSRDRVRSARARLGEAELFRLASARPRPLALRLDPSGFDVVAEYKPRTPSRGVLVAAHAPGPVARGAAYARGGACAVSVLTEPTAFGGSLEALAELSRPVSLPTMRKDFPVDPYQVIEARAHGASGVLLIARLLEAGPLAEMIDAAASLELFALIEVFDAKDLDRAATHLGSTRGTVLLGVNARDLRTLAVDATRHAALAHRVPAGVHLVAESGLATPEDVARVARLGYVAALVGEALMRADDPAHLLQRMIACGREAVTQREVTR